MALVASDSCHCCHCPNSRRYTRSSVGFVVASSSIGKSKSTSNTGIGRGTSSRAASPCRIREREKSPTKFLSRFNGDSLKIQCQRSRERGRGFLLVSSSSPLEETRPLGLLVRLPIICSAFASMLSLLHYLFPNVGTPIRPRPRTHPAGQKTPNPPHGSLLSRFGYRKHVFALPIRLLETRLFPRFGYRNHIFALGSVSGNMSLLPIRLPKTWDSGLSYVCVGRSFFVCFCI